MGFESSSYIPNTPKSTIQNPLEPVGDFINSIKASSETQKILKELPGKTITPEMLPRILDALRSKTIGDDVIPSFIEDIEVGDTVKFSKDKKSVTIKSVQNIPKFIIVFQQEDLSRPDVLSQKPFGKGEPLGDFLNRRGPAPYKKNSCGPAVCFLLETYGIPGLPKSGRDGKNWDRILESPSLSQYFEKVTCPTPMEAQAGDICVYDEGAALGKRTRRTHGHVEVKGSDNQYYSYYASATPGGSCKTTEKDPAEYKRLTGFTGYIYRIRPVS